MTKDIFRFDKEIPGAVLPVIKKHLTPLFWLLPPWCQICWVFWEDSGQSENLRDGASISASMNYDYRRVSLTFYPCFLTMSDAECTDACIHDLLHCITCILADYARDEIKRLLPDEEAPKYRAAVMAELTTRHESMTQDLAFIVGKIIARSRPA